MIRGFCFTLQYLSSNSTYYVLQFIVQSVAHFLAVTYLIQ